jgi:glucose/arabinose dehydrogenase
MTELRPSIPLMLVAGLAVACGEADPRGAPAAGAAAVEGGSMAADLPTCDQDDGGLVLPDGFCALVVHEGVGAARHIAVTEDGRVFVTLDNRRGERGGVVALRDSNGDGRLDQMARFGPDGGTGIGIDGGYLYFAPDTHVLRWPLPPEGSLAPSGEPERVIDGFPDQRSHASKTLAFDGQGGLWVNVGAPSNNCGINDRQEGARGQDPCPELERQGGVWRFDARRIGQRQDDGQRWATGIRNAVALAYNPIDDVLYAVQHGRDQLNVVAPDRFTPQQNADLPSEEFIRLDEGADYGWPYCYHDPQQQRRVLAPEYGGDGTEVGRCEEFTPPLTAFPAHWAPNELLFYTGTQFPESYRGGAFIAWHGSWNRAPEPQRGYKVTFQQMSGGRPSAEWSVFADGFAGRDEIPSPGDAEFRPMGLAEGPDGTLYIADSQQGRIWRVVHRGPQGSARN